MRHALLLTSLMFLVVAEIGPGVCDGQAVVVRKPLKELIESLTEYLGKRGGRQLGTEIAALGGETALHELLERTAREGGEEAVERLVRLSKSLGPDVIHAAENAPNASKVLVAIEELPGELAPRAVSRLAAGAEGSALAGIVDQCGTKALRAEVRHPGVGGRLVSSLGDEGAQLSARLNTDGAIELARHAGDIARLPAAERGQLLRIIEKDPKGMIDFMKRFAEQNPGKILFTVSTAALVVANHDAILGGRGQILLDKEGNPKFIPAPGMIERLILAVLQPLLKLLVPIIAAAAIGYACVKLWHAHKRAGYKTAGIAVETREQATDSRKETGQH